MSTTELPEGASLEKTETHGYYANDGYWYTGKKVEHYFKKAPQWGTLSILKELYSDDLLKDLVYKDNPFLKIIK